MSHPRCVVKIQVREENPILYTPKTQLNIKLSLLQHYNNMFRPKLSAIFRLYMKHIYSYNYSMHALIYCVDGVGGI